MIMGSLSMVEHVGMDSHRPALGVACSLGLETSPFCDMMATFERH